MFLLVASALGQLVLGPDSPEQLRKGVVVEKAARSSGFSSASLEPGDILLNWKRSNLKGTLDTPFDFYFTKTEQGSRGPIQFEGLRGGRRRVWLTADWPTVVRPNLAGFLRETYLEAEQLRKSGKPDECADRLRIVAATAQRLNIPWLAAWFLLHGASAAFRTQRWELSTALFQEASDKAFNAGPIVRGQIFTDWANALQYRDELAEAEKYYELALEEWRKVEPEPVSISAGLYRLAAMANGRGEPTRAEEYNRQGLTAAQEVAPMSSYVAWGFNALGTDALDRGDLAAANRYLRQALVLEEQLFPRDKIAASTLQSLGILHFQLGDPVQADAYYRRALAAMEREYPDAYQIAWILDDIALCALEGRNQRKAEEYANRALTISEKMAWTGSTVAESLLVLGRVARARGDLANAEAYYERGLTIARKSSAQFEAARLMIALGDLARQQRSFSRAEGYYRDALKMTDNFGQENFDHEQTEAALAGALWKQGKLDLAAQTYEQVLSALESQRVHIGGSFEALSSFRAHHAAYYGEYSDLLVTQHQNERGFEVLERSRAQTLVEMLATAHVDIHRGVGPDLVKRESDLKEAISAKSNARLRLVTGKHSDADATTLEKQITDLLATYQDVKGQIRESSPGYAALTQPRALTAHEIQALLDPDTVLLEYSLGDERSHVWLVTRDSITPYNLPKRAVIEPLARRVYRLLATWETIGTGTHSKDGKARRIQVEKDFERAATELSEMILTPVVPMLGSKRLAIVSDGALHLVPFGTLPASMEVRPSGLRNARVSMRFPLIAQHEIVNLPSASLLAELRRMEHERQEPPKEVAVFADPVFDIRDDRVNRAIPVERTTGSLTHKNSMIPDQTLTRSLADLGLSEGGEFHLARLPATRREAAAILATAPRGSAMRALDFDASRATATSAELAQYRIVHFATHGLVDSERPELSGLVLSMVDRHGHAQNGFLQLEDIYNMNLPVDLVVLSACQTGLGKEVNGEGIVGLTRGFMYAGAPTVVASLWDVNDRATAELMGRFYRAMESDKMKPAAALRAAQVQMWKTDRWHSPFYWGAFQIQGEWN